MKRHKPINPFILNLMQRDGYSNLHQAATGWGVPYATLHHLADISKGHTVYESILEFSERVNVMPGELLQGVIDGKKELSA